MSAFLIKVFLHSEDLKSISEDFLSEACHWLKVSVYCLVEIMYGTLARLLLVLGGKAGSPSLSPIREGRNFLYISRSSLPNSSNLFDNYSKSTLLTAPLSSSKRGDSSIYFRSVFSDTSVKDAMVLIRAIPFS